MRGASARLTRGPECTAHIKGRLRSRSLGFLLDRTSAVKEPEFLNAIDKTGKSLEPKLCGEPQQSYGHFIHGASVQAKVRESYNHVRTRLEFLLTEDALTST